MLINSAWKLAINLEVFESLYDGKEKKKWMPCLLENLKLWEREGELENDTFGYYNHLLCGLGHLSRGLVY